MSYELEEIADEAVVPVQQAKRPKPQPEKLPPCPISVSEQILDYNDRQQLHCIFYGVGVLLAISATLLVSFFLSFILTSGVEAIYDNTTLLTATFWGFPLLMHIVIYGETYFFRKRHFSPLDRAMQAEGMIAGYDGSWNAGNNTEGTVAAAAFVSECLFAAPHCMIRCWDCWKSKIQDDYHNTQKAEKLFQVLGPKRTWVKSDSIKEYAGAAALLYQLNILWIRFNEKNKQWETRVDASLTHQYWGEGQYEQEYIPADQRHSH